MSEVEKLERIKSQYASWNRTKTSSNSGDNVTCSGGGDGCGGGNCSSADCSSIGDACSGGDDD